MWELFHKKSYIALFLFFLVLLGFVFFWQAGIFEFPFLHIRSVRAVPAPLWELIFTGGVVILSSLFLTGLFGLFEDAQSKVQAKEGTTGTLGLLLAAFALLCPICNVGLLVSFGIAFNLAFFMPYLWLIHVLAILLLVYSVVILDQRLKVGAGSCPLPVRK